jgi:hypothetical protein
MGMRCESGFCSHPACEGRGETLLGSSIKKLCVRHNAERLRAGKPVKSSKPKYKDWKKDPRKVLDNLFSKYILKKYGLLCYTCDHTEHIIECGHYMGRSNDATRWDEDNARPQGQICNRFEHGKHNEFRARLISEIGLFRVLEVERKAKLAVKFSKQDIEEMIDRYSA